MIYARKRAALGCIGILLFVAGCKQQPSTAETEQTIRDLDAQWAKTAGTHDLDGTVAYYADDAVLLPPNEPLISGKAALRTSWTALLAPNIALTWHAGKVDVSQSGDLAYVVGSYDLSTKDAQGKPVSDHGKTIEVSESKATGPGRSWRICTAQIYLRQRLEHFYTPALSVVTWHFACSPSRRSEGFA